jgi:hypothetical protein
MDVVLKVEAVGSQSGKTSAKARARTLTSDAEASVLARTLPLPLFVFADSFVSATPRAQVSIVDSGELPVEAAAEASA